MHNPRDVGLDRCEAYLIFVTTITTGGCGEKICHVEKIFPCDRLSCGEVSPHDKCSVGDMSPHGK